MGIGRRSFIKLMTAALAGASVDPLQAVVIHEDWYVNKKLGVIFRKPANWHFIAVKDFGRLKEEQILAEDYDDWKNDIYESLGDPVCVITKYGIDDPKYKGVFSPTIVVNITPKQEVLGIWGNETFEDVIEISKETTAQILQDFRVEKSYGQINLCNCISYEFDAKYTFNHLEMDEPVEVELKVIKVDHGQFFYDFSMHQSLAANQPAESEFLAFKESIEMV